MKGIFDDFNRRRNIAKCLVQLIYFIVSVQIQYGTYKFRFLILDIYHEY